MSTFFTADTHFDHDNILNLGQGRPFGSINHHNETLIQNYNYLVQPSDKTYFLGDVALGNLEQSIQLLSRMNGQKFLVPGNHDRIFSGTNTKSRIERFLPIYEEAGFVVLPENTSIDFDGQEVLLSHFPYSENWETFSKVDKFAKSRPVDTGLPLLHGHTHFANRLTEGNPRMLNVGVDANNFFPVGWAEVKLWLDSLQLTVAK